MYSGNIALTQGLETVIQAATHLAAYPDIMFVIVGEQQALQELRQYCQQQGAKNVMLLPFQPREQLPTMLAAADVGLIVQRQQVVSFNMPSKTQLLLASGRPIIASVPLNGSAAQVVAQSQGGIVVPPEQPEALAQAVLKLYQNQDYGAQLGNQGRAYAMEQYRFEGSLQAYEQVFQGQQRRRSQVSH
jgi:colanic acid biosynthesis glycosyl transferase WcaI